MTTADSVALICQHQSAIVDTLAYMGGIMPVASILAWLAARWQKMPPGAQAILQLISGNLMHSLFGEPTQPQPAPAPPAQPPAQA